MMKVFCAWIFSFLIYSFDFSPNTIHQGRKSLIDACQDFNDLNTKIRDGKIEKKEAITQFQLLIPKIKLLFYEHGGKEIAQSEWHFPVQGYDKHAIGGTNGSGYNAIKYHYFDGNAHLGHPAHDIFIRDHNQDCKDDRTTKEVNVLSMSSGVVIAFDSSWDVNSNLRGGKYIWIYDPGSNNLFYYAHNATILVQPGSLVKPGDIIATIGRTGLNAHKKRSPTHLHFMQLKFDTNYYLKPANCYQSLIKAKATP